MMMMSRFVERVLNSPRARCRLEWIEAEAVALDIEPNECGRNQGKGVIYTICTGALRVPFMLAIWRHVKSDVILNYWLLCCRLFLCATGADVADWMIDGLHDLLWIKALLDNFRLGRKLSAQLSVNGLPVLGKQKFIFAVFSVDLLLIAYQYQLIYCSWCWRQRMVWHCGVCRMNAHWLWEPFSHLSLECIDLFQ